MFQLVGVTKLSCPQLECLTQLVIVRRLSWDQLRCPGLAACPAPPRPCCAHTAAAAPPDSPWSGSASAAPRPARTAPSGTCRENIFIECLKNIFIEYQYSHSRNMWLWMFLKQLAIICRSRELEITSPLAEMDWKNHWIFHQDFPLQSVSFTKILYQNVKC